MVILKILFYLPIGFMINLCYILFNISYIIDARSKRLPCYCSRCNKYIHIPKGQHEENITNIVKCPYCNIRFNHLDKKIMKYLDI